MANYKSSTNDGKCVFCEIIKENVQTPGKFWEDEEFMAFYQLGQVSKDLLSWCQKNTMPVIVWLCLMIFYKN